MDKLQEQQPQATINSANNNDNNPATCITVHEQDVEIGSSPEYRPSAVSPISVSSSRGKGWDDDDDDDEIEQAPSDYYHADKTNTAATDTTRKRKRLCWILTVLALLVVLVTGPFLIKSLRSRNGSNSNDEGDSADFGAIPGSNDGTYNAPTVEEEKETSNGSSTDTANAPNNNKLVPFQQVDLPFFTQDILRGYSNQAELEKALTEAAKFLVNRIVRRNLHQSSNPMVGQGGGWGPNDSNNNNDGNVLTWRGTSQEEGSNSNGFFQDVTEYETNNQEQGIDEGDLIKADENFIYAAYEDYMIVWNTKGQQVTQVQMPSMETEDNGTESSSSSSSSTFGNVIFTSPVTSTTANGSKPRIESLLLVEDRLVVIVSYGTGTTGNSGESTILVDHLTTQIRTYSTATIDKNRELTLIGTKVIHGRFLDARSIASHVHVATTSGIDTYTHLAAPLERFSQFPDLTDEEYVERAKFQASEKFIPAFVRTLSSELLLRDSAGNYDILQVNRWQPPPTTDSVSSHSRAQVDDELYFHGVVCSIAFVTSLDVAESSQPDGELSTYVSSFLAPSQHIQFYATESKLALATRAWSWNDNLEAAEEVTHLIILAIDENVVQSTFHSVGTIRGYTLNPYSLDIMDNQLRVATTISKRWRFQRQSSDASASNSQHTPQLIDRSVGEEVVEESTTENYITVLDLDNSLTEIGLVQVGHKDEVIMAVRFFDKIAYCVTFRQTDPFYVIDLEVNSISVLGSFKQNGFSNYLHPLNEDKTLLLGIGQNTTEEGIVDAFMITVFDATDATRPEALVSFTVDDSPLGSGQSSQSVAQWEYKSFRYVDGKLIVPMNIVAYTTEGSTADANKQTILGTFDGFVVFNVDTRNPSEVEITEHFRVSHQSVACHHCGHLPPRSFVYDGSLITTAGNIVSSADLRSTKENWAFHVEVAGEEPLCCY